MQVQLSCRYRKKHLGCVRHITLDPKGPGVVRLHMLPPRAEEPKAPFLLLLNGAQLLPLNLSWAILLANFMDQMESFSGREIAEGEWQAIVQKAVSVTRRTYPGTKRAQLESELQALLDSLVAVARGKESPVEVAPVSLGEYADKTTAPHRMDLMLSAMTRGGAWHCGAWHVGG